MNKSKKSKKSKPGNGMNRLIFSALAIIIQVTWIVVQLVRLDNYSTVISMISGLISVIIVLSIYSREMNANMKMPWIILILVFPVMGVCIYFLCGHSGVNGGKRKRFEKIQKKLDIYLEQDETVTDKLKKEDKAVANQCHYIHEYGRYPVYTNTDVDFYSEAADGFEAQKAAMANAKEFIFMEYHAIEDAEAFAGMKKILFEKAHEGVEIRIIYDDMGSISFINSDFVKAMEAEGIQVRVFNKIMPVLNIFMNNRDHRKVTVVDGKVAFTGGYNLADEYFNITHPHGYWKDTGIRMEGDAVHNMTALFLEMWNAIEDTDADYGNYFPHNPYNALKPGFVQPYADDPLDKEQVGENVYMNILNNAEDYVWFMTPYLIITDEMRREFVLAAKRGVDIRIITPGIPDKNTVYEVTRSYYNGLVKGGVHIYEYTPGFCHGKQCISDDVVATVGTINLDYRSLYYHYENGVFLYHCPAVADIKKDFEETFPHCEEVTENYKQRSRALRLGQYILRLFAPLM